MDDGILDEEIAQLVADARQTWATITRAWLRIDYFVRLECPGVRSVVTAEAYVERLIRDLKRTASTGIWVFGAIHEQPFLHGHAVIHLSRRLAGQFTTVEQFRGWFRRYWYHGPMWAAVYDETKQLHRGAVGYAARDPGTVVWG